MGIDVIAEIGWNFVGDLELAKKMIESAARSGATYAKFQTWSVKDLKDGPWNYDGRREIYEKAELSIEDHQELKNHCFKNNIKFLTSVFCDKDVDFISTLTDTIKIPSQEIANEKLLNSVANKNFRKVFLSCGAAKKEEIKRVVEIFDKSWSQLILLHCVSSYPCPYENANLRKIDFLQNLGKQVGYSGHIEGIFDAIASIERGVVVIEKHFTIDKSLPGRDNKFAILPDELKFLCDYIKAREKMLSNYTEGYQESEEEIRKVYRGRWQS